MTAYKVATQLGACKWGYMIWPTHDNVVGKSLELYGEYSPVETKLLCSIAQPGMTVVEVGANLGALSVPLARRLGDAGMLIAFEPQVVINKLLLANLAMNDCFTAQVLLAAAGEGGDDEELTIPMYTYTEDANYGALGREAWNKASSGMKVPVIGIDALGLKCVQIMKIDAEGMELEVLHGAKNTITSNWPWMFIENDRNKGSKELIQYLKNELGYKLQWFSSFLYSDDNYFENKTNVFESQCSFNMICTPPKGPMARVTIGGLKDVNETDEIGVCDMKDVVVGI